MSIVESGFLSKGANYACYNCGLEFHESNSQFRLNKAPDNSKIKNQFLYKLYSLQEWNIIISNNYSIEEANNTFQQNQKVDIDYIEYGKEAVEETVKIADDMVENIFNNIKNKHNEWNKKREEMKEASMTNVKERTNSDADELIKWHQMMEQGIITEEEFEHKKREILGF